MGNVMAKLLRTIVNLSSHCTVFEVHKLPNPVLTDFFKIYLQSSIPTRPMAHPPSNVPASSLTQ